MKDRMRKLLVKILSMIGRSERAISGYVVGLTQASAAALIASAVIVPATSVEAILGGFVCVGLGIAMVVWQNNRE